MNIQINENNVFKNRYGDTIHWSAVIELVSSNKQVDALMNKEYYELDDYEENTLEDIKQTAYLALENECAEQGRRVGQFEVTYILYDKEEDKLIMKIDDNIEIEW